MAAQTPAQKAYLDNLGFAICLKRATADAKLIIAFQRYRVAKLRETTPLVRLAGDDGRIETPQEQLQDAAKMWVEYVKENVWRKMPQDAREALAVEALAQHLTGQTTAPTAS